jgi:GAF domain-containing protein/anti-sigma regulatory factor (Ser/Thr protein kinase)
MKRLEPQGAKRKRRAKSPSADAGAQGVRRAMAQADAVEQNKAITDILRVISSSPGDLQPVFDTILSHATRLCGATMANVFRYDGAVLEMVAAKLPAASLEVLRREYPSAPNRGKVSGRVVLDRKIVEIPDIREDAEYQGTAPRAGGIRSLLGVPLLRDGRAIGAIVIARPQAGEFAPRQVAMVQTFAEQAVIAIENVRLFNETKEALERQTATADILKVISSSPTDLQPVFRAIVSSAVRLTGAHQSTLHYGAILQFDGETISVAAISPEGPEYWAAWDLVYPAPITCGTPTARALLDKTVVHLSDIEHDLAPLGLTAPASTRLAARSLLVVPMLRDGRVLGAIVTARGEAGGFSDKQVALLQTFADQAVIAIENVRLFNETKESLERQTATAEILRVISSTPTNTEPVFDAIVESGVRLFEGSAVAVSLPEGEQVRLAAIAASDPEDVTRWRKVYPFPLTRERMHGIALLENRLVDVPDVERSGGLPGEDGKRAFLSTGNRAITIIPMTREHKAIGAISVIRRAAGPLSEKQIAMLKTFADQAVIAIENVRLFNETKEALEQQTATAGILNVISRSPTDMQPVFEAIVESAARLFESFTAVITMREGDFLQRKARAGPNLLMSKAEREELDKIYPLPLDPQVSISARAIIEGRTVEVLDTEAAELSDVAKRIGRLGKHRSVTAVPLVREAEAIGTIVLTRPEPGCKLSEKQLALVKTFADQAVIAIENVRLFNELQTTNGSLREALEQQTATGDILKVISRSTTDVRPVFETIIRNAVRLCDGAFGMLFTFDGKMLDIGAQFNNSAEVLDMFRREYPQPVDRATPSGRAIVEGSVINIPDVLASDYSQSVKDRARASGWRGGLTVPLTRDNAAIGAIAVVRREPGAFSDSYVALLQTFADQAVIAIENVRLFNETKEALEQQTAISEVLRVISSSPTDVKPVLEAVCMRAARICDASDARIFLAEGESLRHAAGFGDVPVRTDVIPLSGTVGGHAILDGAPIHIEDIQAESGREYPIARQFATEAGWRTILTVPLIREKTALGTISLRRREVRAFTEKQITLLKTFADQAAIAIENVRLFNETKEALEQQKASADVLGVISSSIADTKPVFDKILESCQRLFAGRNVGINVVGDDGKVHIGAYKGFGRAELEAHFPVPLSMESGSGAAIVQRQVVHYPDCEAPDVPEYARRGGKIAGNRSVLFAPMLWEGRGIGAIFVGRPVVGPYSDKEIALLRTFADQAAIAIQNARLFREIQEKSAQLEVANKHKSDFLANMSHELRTPLNAIIGFSEALMERMFGELNDKQGDYLKDIHESGKHLLSLINDILDLSKIEAGRMDLELSSFHLPTALSNAMTLIRERAQRHSIDLHLDVDKRLGEFQADERKFKQIMLNLLSNAVKFTPDGGRVDVSATKDTDKIEIAVKDTGIGIATEDQAVVFEEFKQVGGDQRRKAEGTGLGLALTKRFVELHGGAIRLESTPGKGSTFTVSLPLRQ